MNFSKTNAYIQHEKNPINSLGQLAIINRSIQLIKLNSKSKKRSKVKE